MGAGAPPNRPHFTGYRFEPYKLTPTDEIRLLAEGFSTGEIERIRNTLTMKGSVHDRWPRRRLQIDIDMGGMTITHY